MAADESNSDCELVIDEDCVEISSDEEYETSIFHPMSITSADLQAELFHEDDAFTCTICNETFRYNVALICHMEMEHVAAKIDQPIPTVRSKRNLTSPKGVKRKYAKKATPKSVVSNDSEQIEPQDLSKVSSSVCECCKKKFTAKHSMGLRFTCAFCHLRFCWESKYKKHLHKTHKLNAVVICRLCSAVFDDMMQLASHSQTCPNRVQDAVPLPDEDSQPLPKESGTDDAMEEVSVST